MNVENTEIVRKVLDTSTTELEEPKNKAYYQITEYGGQNIAVGYVDARKKNDDGELVGRTIIWPQAYMARMDKFERQRMEIIADALDARVIGVEAPGIGISRKSKLTIKNRLGLVKGSFHSSAKSMLGAVNEVFGFNENEEVELMGYSQGAAIVAEMANILSDDKNKFHFKSPHTSTIEAVSNDDDKFHLKLPRVTVIEAVNDQKRGLFDLLKKINEEEPHTDRYLEQNEKYDWLVPPTDRIPEGKIEVELLNKKQRIATLLGGLALRGAFAPSLLRAIKSDKRKDTTGISKSRIDFIKFDESGMSRLEQNYGTVEQLQRVMSLGGAAVLNIITAPDGQEGYRHPSVHSGDFIHELVKRIYSD